MQKKPGSQENRKELRTLFSTCFFFFFFFFLFIIISSGGETNFLFLFLLFSVSWTVLTLLLYSVVFAEYRHLLFELFGYLLSVRSPELELKAACDQVLKYFCNVADMIE